MSRRKQRKRNLFILPCMALQRMQKSLAVEFFVGHKKGNQVFMIKFDGKKHVLKEENENHLYKLWNGLSHLFQDNKVKIFQFERKIQGGYRFSTLNYLD